jgi:hypothetical protein
MLQKSWHAHLIWGHVVFVHLQYAFVYLAMLCNYKSHQRVASTEKLHLFERKEKEAGNILEIRTVFPNQGSAEHRQGFHEKLWNK